MRPTTLSINDTSQVLRPRSTSTPSPNSNVAAIASPIR
jgi:hypothetical protein